MRTQLQEDQERRRTLGREDLWICFALVWATLALYYQVRHFDFINFDDPDYVYRNPHLRDGLSLRGIAWAFTSGEHAYWFPVTRLSHLLDYTLFGLRGGYHHLSSVLFHALASVLSFVFLMRASGARGRSAFVAFVFALHPLHVESAAWISERKDVLCAVFWLLTLLAWVRYTERPGRTRYLLALMLFALGLMAKPMIVTLPFVLLLVDAWPLGRKLSWKLVLEKIPFLALAAAGSAIAYFTQANDHAVQPLGKFPLGLRVENALIEWIVYIARTFWPARLSITYPYPSHFPLREAVAAGLALAAISAAVWRARSSRPWLACGWFWYLGTLVPVIGLVQVGAEARADHFLYVPMIGLSIMVAWGAGDLLRLPPRALSAAAVTVCAALAVVSWIQIGYWKDSVTLYRHAIAVTSGNYTAWLNLGSALVEIPGQIPEAAADFEEAVRIKPDFPEAHTNLGNCLFEMGRLAEAIAQYRAAMQIDPNDPQAHTGMGVALWSEGRRSDAMAEYRLAIRLDPASAMAHYNLGFALAATGQLPEAIGQYKEAVRIDPDYASAYLRLGDALLTGGATEDAIAQYEEAVRIAPNFASAHSHLGAALLRAHGLVVEALPHFEEAVRLDPASMEAQLDLGNALLQLSGRKPEGIAHLEAAYRLRPDPALREKLDRLEAVAQPSRR